MKILYVINDGIVGGLQKHVLCLMEALKGIAETALIINIKRDSQLIPMFEERGLKVYLLDGKSGHDWRIIGRFRKALLDFNPDIIHAHVLPLFCLLYLVFSCHRIPLMHSLHTSSSKHSFVNWLVWKLLLFRVAYWLPVSTSTWEGFRKANANMQGEVFFNPILLADYINHGRDSVTWKGENPVVGMVGRKAKVKDWPSFHAVEKLVRAKMPDAIFLNAGEEAICDGRAAIASMDLFIMTSISEELPTTLLECFALGTPVCGFVPKGGTKEILAFSDGSLRNAFIQERDCKQLAKLVIDLLNDHERRSAIAADGMHIVKNHFAAETLVPGRLMDIYAKFT